MLKELAEDSEEWLELVDETLELFVDNPNDTRLELHELLGKLKGRSAISVTDDIRIVFRWVNKGVVKLIRVGDHEKVYGIKRKRE